jgi:hypothetical protein
VNGGALTKQAENPNCKPGSSSATTTSALNSPEENAMVNTIVAMQLHTTPDKVSGVETLLGAPLLRGQQVKIK